MNKRVITSLAAAAMIFGVVGTASATQSASDRWVVITTDDETNIFFLPAENCEIRHQLTKLAQRRYQWQKQCRCRDERKFNAITSTQHLCWALRLNNDVNSIRLGERLGKGSVDWADTARGE